MRLTCAIKFVSCYYLYEDFMEKETNKITTRLPISLTADDNRILLELCHKIEKRENTRLSMAELIRRAIRTQAKLEGIECN